MEEKIQELTTVMQVCSRLGADVNAEVIEKLKEEGSYEGLKVQFGSMPPAPEGSSAYELDIAANKIKQAAVLLGEAIAKLKISARSPG